MAVFAIGPQRADIGGYGGSSPRETTALGIYNSLSASQGRCGAAAALPSGQLRR
jgi:hypothetical protein